MGEQSEGDDLKLLVRVQVPVDAKTVIYAGARKWDLPENALCDSIVILLDPAGPGSINENSLHD